MRLGCHPPPLLRGEVRTGARIVALLKRRGGLSAHEIRDALGLTSNITHSSLRALRKAKRAYLVRRGVNQNREGLYTL